MANVKYEDGVVKQKYDINDNIKGNSSVDLNTIKQVLNSGEGDLADALRVGLEANQKVGPLNLEAFLNSALGENKNVTYGLAGHLGDESNYLKGSYSKSDIDAINQAAVAKALEGQLKYGDATVKGKYSDTEGPFDAKSITKSIEGTYNLTPNMNAKAVYKDKDTSYGVSDIEKGLALEYLLKNGVISADYNEKNGNPLYGVSFGLAF